MSYTEKILIAGETVLYKTGVHWIVLLGPGILSGFLVLFGVGAFVGHLFALGSIFIAVAAITMGVAILSRNATESFKKLSTAGSPLSSDTKVASSSVGLTSEEAANRLAQIGPNTVSEKRKSIFNRIASHFWAPVPWMLELAIVLQLVIGERLEAAMISALLIFNVGLGVFQEHHADAALTLLKKQLSLKAQARRDGQWTELPAKVLAPGDIVRLSLGTVVPADVKILDGSVLLDQSMLTGESVPVETDSGKRAYASALVRRGEAVGTVIATGASTYFGRTAELVGVAHVESSEVKAVLGLVRSLSALNTLIVIGLIVYAHAIALPVSQITLLVLTAMLSAVPVALPATFTLASTLGARTLAKRGVLLTRLTALQEAAMIDVLCADKTGTLPCSFVRLL